MSGDEWRPEQPLNGRIELYLNENPDFQHPDSVSIHVGRLFQRMHFVHATRDTVAPRGTTVAVYVIRYSDESLIEIPVILGRDIEDRFQAQRFLEGVQIAWQGSNQRSCQEQATLTLFRMKWENQKPTVPVQSVEFVSKCAGAAPFLVAITVL